MTHKHTSTHLNQLSIVSQANRLIFIGPSYFTVFDESSMFIVKLVTVFS